MTSFHRTANLTRAAALLIALAGLGLAALASTLPAKGQQPARDQRDPNLVFLGGERDEYLLVWSEDRGSGSRIYAKRIRSNGLPIGGATGGEWEATRSPQPGSGPPVVKGDQRWPAIIPGLLVYSERVPGGADYDLYAQRLFDNGRPAGVPMLVAGGPGDQRYGDVVAVDRGSAGNEYLIVWSEDTRDQGDVMGIRVDYALRRSRGPAFPIAQGPGTAEDPAIGRDLLDPDNFLVLYTDDRSGNKDIYGVRLASSGLPRGGAKGGPFPVVQSPEDDYAPEIVTSLQPLTLGRTPTPTPKGMPPRRPESGPNSLVLWTYDDLVDGPNVMAQRLASNGLPRGEPFTVAGGTGVQAWPAAALLDATLRQLRVPEREEWLTVWCDDATGTLDILSVAVEVSGAIRQARRTVVSD